MMRLAALLVVLPLALSCGVSPDGSEIPEGASTAADSLIDKAQTPEERQELIAVRDEVDAEKRKEAAALDAEIERLERENAALRRAKR